MTDEQLQLRATQLRKPQGEDGIKTAEWMSKGNQHIIHDTLEVLCAEAQDNILEIGMGNGLFVKEILSKDQSISYTGCDYSKLMVEESERINANWIINGQATFVHSNVASLPFAGGTFNKIFTINTIYFWDNESKVLDELKRVLQSHGKLIISFRPKHHAEKHPFTKFGFNLFTKEEIVTLLSENGFSISDVIENHEPDFKLDGKILKMENVIVVAVKN